MAATGQRPTGRVFRPSIKGSIAALAGVAFLLGLAGWQWSRYLEKQALWDGFASGTDQLIELPRAAVPPKRFSHVQVSGRYLGERQFLLDNMSHDGEAGYRVLTPLDRPGAETILVDRGWVPHRSSGRLPDLAVSADSRTLTGRADLLPRRGVNLTDHPGKEWPKLMSYPTIDALERELGRPLYPQILLLDASAPDAFVRDWQPPGLPPAQHLGYAITWLGCALTLAFLFVRASRRPVTQS